MHIEQIGDRVFLLHAVQPPQHDVAAGPFEFRGSSRPLSLNPTRDLPHLGGLRLLCVLRRQLTKLQVIEHELPVLRIGGVLGYLQGIDAKVSYLLSGPMAVDTVSLKERSDRWSYGTFSSMCRRRN